MYPVFPICLHCAIWNHSGGTDEYG